MSSPVLIEVCIDSVASAVASEQGGADRVELCDNLMEGGTTPSAGTIAVARRRISIGLHVIIRPRGGDFCYAPDELDVMRHDIQLAKQLGADGVVFGMLTPDGDVDLPLTRELVALARPMRVTFHRAFDVARDPRAALEDLIAAGAERVLTTGQEGSLMEGLDLVADLVRQAAGRIIVMPGGASERHIARVRQATGASEFHVLATRTVESAMRHRNERVFMGGTLRPPEYGREEIDAAVIRRMRERAG